VAALSEPFIMADGGRAASIARLSGRLHARIQVGSGLWLFARFPDRIASRQQSPDAVGLEEVLCEERRTGADAAVEHAMRAMVSRHEDPWCARCERAFHIGLAVSILGAWG
jgi:hypothetical protein